MKRLLLVFLLHFFNKNSFLVAQVYSKISCGWAHASAIKTDGTLWAWGYNSYGVLGNGNYTDQNIPIQVGAATNWQSVSSGFFHTLGIKTDGTLWAWGSDQYGQLGLGGNSDTNTPIQVGTATNWQSVSCGWTHSLGIKTDGTLWAWGENSDGQLGIGNNTTQNIPTQVGTTTNWQSVTGGGYYTMAIKTNSTLWAWGDNLKGQLGIGNNTDQNIPIQVGSATNWQSVGCGYAHTMGIKTDGKLWTWGYNNFGQLGIGNNTNQNIPIQVGTATNWQSATGSENHTILKKTDGTVWACGNNFYGQLGVGNNTNQNIPSQVGTATNWQSVSCGTASFTIGIKTDGTLWGWGINNLVNHNVSTLGIGNFTNQNTPTKHDGDDCNGAWLIGLSNPCVVEYYSNTLSTASNPLGSNCGLSGWRDRWFQVAPAYEQFNISTGNLPAGTTTIDVFSGCGGSNIWCSTIAPNSVYTITAPAGNYYFIRVSKPISDPTGDIELCFSQIPPNDDCSGAINVPLSPDGGGLNIGYLNSANIEWTSSGTTGCGMVSEGDLWFKVTTTQPEFKMYFGDCYLLPTNLSVFDNCGGSQLLCHTQTGSEEITMTVPAGTYYIRVSDDITEQYSDSYIINGSIYELIAAPIELHHFTAQKVKKTAHLLWRTASETQNRGFEIHRSSDGENWQKIGWRDGAGTTTEEQDYSFVDANPLPWLNHYRLAQQDFDGKETFSQAVSVEFGEHPAMLVSPSPAGETVNLSWHAEGEGPTTVRAWDLTGRLFFSQKTEADALELSVGGWPAGIYKIERASGPQVERTRLVVFH